MYKSIFSVLSYIRKLFYIYYIEVVWNDINVSTRCKHVVNMLVGNKKSHGTYQFIALILGGFDLGLFTASSYDAKCRIWIIYIYNSPQEKLW